MKWLLPLAVTVAAMAPLLIVFGNSYFLHGYQESKDAIRILYRGFSNFDDEVLALFDVLPSTHGSKMQMSDDFRDYLRCYAGIECSNRFANVTKPPPSLMPKSNEIDDYVEDPEELEYIKSLSPAELEEMKEQCCDCDRINKENVGLHEKTHNK